MSAHHSPQPSLLNPKEPTMRSALLFSIASRQLAIESGEAQPTAIHVSAMRGLSDSEHRILRGYVRAMRALNHGVKK